MKDANKTPLKDPFVPPKLERLDKLETITGFDFGGPGPIGS